MNTKKDIVKVAKPKLMRFMEEINSEVIDIKDEYEMNNISFSDCEIRTKTADKLKVDGVIFNKMDFKDIFLKSLELTDVRFENCDLSNADFSGAVIHRAEFINCNYKSV